jgi:type I restriction enzyme S subunit
MSLSESAELSEAFSESDLPWKVDIVDWSVISDDFRKVIARDKVVVQESQQANREVTILPLEACLDALIDYRGKTPRKVDAGIPLITAKVVKDGRIEPPDEFIAEEDYETWMTRGYPRVGDVVLTTEAPLGEVGQIKYLPVALAQRIITLRGKPDVLDSDYLLYLLQSDEMQTKLLGRSTGTTVVGIKQSELRKIELTLPPIGEQRAIAHILGTLDDKIELNRRRNQTLESMARALFKDWFVDFGPVRARMEGRDPYLPADLWQLFPDRLDDEGKPEGWAYIPVGEFAELKGGKQLKKEKIAPSGPIPVFGGAGVMGYTDSHNADGFVIAVGRVGAYCGQFFSHRGKAWINNNASLIKQTEDDLAEWLFLSLSHTNIDVIKKGAAQPFVSNGDIAKLPLMWPTEALVHVFTDIVGPVQKKKDQNDVESRTLAQLRETLLPKLISGELRIADAEKFMEERAA